MADAPRDENRTATILGVSSVDGSTPTRVKANPSTGAMLTEITGGSSSGTQYTEGDTDASITGTAILWEDTSNTLRPASAAKPFPVEIVAGADLDIRDLTNADVVTAELSATDNAVLDTIDAVLDTIKVDTEAIETAVEAIQAGQLADGHNVTIDNASGASAVNIQDGGNTITVDGTVAVTGVATAANQTTIIGHLDGVEGLLTTIDADTGSILTSVQTLDNAISGSEMQVDVVGALPAGTNAIGKLTQPATGTLANVTMTGSSVTLAASNADRRALHIYNDSGVTVYVKFGSTASSTSFTVKMINQAYFELPEPVYTGIGTGLGASGDVRVTEVT